MGSRATRLPAMEAYMTTVDFITDLFCQVDDRLRGLSTPLQACWGPSEVVTLARWPARQGVGNRAF